MFVCACIYICIIYTCISIHIYHLSSVCVCVHTLVQPQERARAQRPGRGTHGPQWTATSIQRTRGEDGIGPEMPRPDTKQSPTKSCRFCCSDFRSESAADRGGDTDDPRPTKGPRRRCREGRERSGRRKERRPSFAFRRGGLRGLRGALVQGCVGVIIVIGKLRRC